jgi:uncharacterized protein (TIGR03437 family)
MKTCILNLATALLCVAGAAAQSVDASGNAALNGNYYVRQVSLAVDPTIGFIEESYSIYGTMAFNGKGTYSFQGHLADSAASAPIVYNVSGVYSVQSNGLAAVQSLLENGVYIFGSVAQGVFSGSSTESAVYTDELVAIPGGTNSSPASLTGSYNFGTIEFLQSDFTARDTYFTINADGTGNIATFTLNGAAANQMNANVTQSVSGATYAFTGNGTGTFTLPSGNLVQGSKIFYVSADGNFVVAGGANTFDMMIGIRASAAPATNTTFSGVYFVTGLETNVTGFSGANGNFDAFAGSVNGTGAGESLWHLRLHSPFYGSYDNTYDVPYVFANGSIKQSSVNFSFGLSGQAFLVVGLGPEYQLSLGLHAPQYSSSGVYLNPIGIVNAANLAPFTNPVAPGEFVSLFGTGLSGGIVQAPSLPLNTTLGNVQVTVNGRPMPLLYVSATQINGLIPYGLDVTSTSYATFIVTNNKVNSNSVTVFSRATSPGVFSINQSGTGTAAVLHANYSPVTAANPAKAGETVQLFLTGLGAVTPSVADGAAAGSTQLSLVNAQMLVEIGNPFLKATVSFAGLAPGFAGLYQLNFVIPAGLTAGDNYLTVSTPDGVTSQTMIAISK